MREKRKENRNEEKNTQRLGFPEKDYYEPKKTVNAFSNNYIQYEVLEIKPKIHQSKNILILQDHI